MSLAESLHLRRQIPGRVTYPAPPDFHGTTFVKQVLIESLAAPDVLQLSVSRMNSSG